MTGEVVKCEGFLFCIRCDTGHPYHIYYIGLNGKFLRFRRDGVSISYTVICLSHFYVCLAIT
jgi:hypothetical protein